MQELRTIHRAELSYFQKYGGYTTDLATLGAGSMGSCEARQGTQTHACLLNEPITHPECSGTNWCLEHLYKFNLQAARPSGTNASAMPTDYVVTATPFDFFTSDTKSFCVMSDGVIHVAVTFSSREKPYTQEECSRLRVL